MQEMIKLDLQSRLPIYEQLKTKISELVLLGAIKPGDQLPSVRVIARELGVNPNTVQKAYQELERDGIIYSVAGRGSYVSPSAELAGQLREQLLQKVRSALLQAKNGKVPKEAALCAVNEIYDRKEGADL